MKTKRLILSLLVALMSVAGAWAQNNVIRYTATNDLAGVFSSLGQVMSSVYDPNTHEGVVTFDDDITAIGNDAFFDCSSLTAIDLPASITSFGHRSFDGCSSLKTVTINSQQTLNATGRWINTFFEDQVEECILNGNITIISEYKFEFSSITSITLPETLTEIEDGAFRFGSLTSITIPASVTSIGLYSFWNCPMQSITVNATTPPTLNSSFLGVNTSIPVYVPKGTVDTYKAATYWKDFTNFFDGIFCRLNLASSDSSLGKVYGAGIYEASTEVTIFAIPEAGSKFTGWSDGNTENPRQYVVMSDATLTANFEAMPILEYILEGYVEGYADGYAEGKTDGYAEAAAELLGSMGEPCDDCPAVEISDDNTTIKLYNPKKVEFMKNKSEE